MKSSESNLEDEKNIETDVTSEINKEILNVSKSKFNENTKKYSFKEKVNDIEVYLRKWQQQFSL